MGMLSWWKENDRAMKCFFLWSVFSFKISICIYVAICRPVHDAKTVHFLYM